MRNFINITNNEKLQTLSGIVRDHSPLMVDNMYRNTERNHNGIWMAHCYDRCENAAQFMIDELRAAMVHCLPQSVINDIDSRYTMALEYQAIAQYNQLDGEEQEGQDLFWEKSDEQADFDDKVNMYYNEY